MEKKTLKLKVEFVPYFFDEKEVRFSFEGEIHDFPQRKRRHVSRTVDHDFDSEVEMIFGHRSGFGLFCL